MPIAAFCCQLVAEPATSGWRHGPLGSLFSEPGGLWQPDICRRPSGRWSSITGSTWTRSEHAGRVGTGECICKRRYAYTWHLHAERQFWSRGAIAVRRTRWTSRRRVKSLGLPRQFALRRKSSRTILPFWFRPQQGQQFGSASGFGPQFTNVGNVPGVPPNFGCAGLRPPPGFYATTAPTETFSLHEPKEMLQHARWDFPQV